MPSKEIHKKKSKSKHKKSHKKRHGHQNNNPESPSHVPGKKWKTEPDEDGHHTHVSRKRAKAQEARAAIVAAQRDKILVPQKISALHKQAITHNRRKFTNPEKKKRVRALGPRPSDLPPRLKLGFRYDDHKPISLFDVVRRGDFKVIKKTLTAKTNEINRPQGQYPRGTLLHVACQCSSEEIIKHMLQNEGDVHARDDLGRTPLMVATRRGEVNIVKLLLTYDVKEKKKQLEARNEENLTAVQIAMQYDEQKIRSFYINHLKLEGMEMSADDRTIGVALAAHEKEKRTLYT